MLNRTGASLRKVYSLVWRGLKKCSIRNKMNVLYSWWENVQVKHLSDMNIQFTALMSKIKAKSYSYCNIGHHLLVSGQDRSIWNPPPPPVVDACPAQVYHIYDWSASFKFCSSVSEQGWSAWTQPTEAALVDACPAYWLHPLLLHSWYIILTAVTVQYTVL